MSALPVIGLAGGIGAGKSTVAERMKELDCMVIDADVIAHDVLDEPEVRRDLVEWFGEQIVGADGTIDRSRIGSIVFSNSADLERLEALVHPRVAAVCAARMAEPDPDAIAIVLDAPLLFESGLDAYCDHIVFIDTPEHFRLERLRLRSGWDAAETARRASMQIGLDEKRIRSHHVLVNAGDSESLHQQVAELLKHLHPRHD
ncbi:MAG: dephospho-CoA kinase [Phycisphaerales bacterium]|jgi:dephospho-CoA kinase|nr:dephospho-CoA kinase [Phycisphaerales bacterium]MDP6890287.1 dephospho-CoA kinase [Phycisphaerales bacterium]